MPQIHGHLVVEPNARFAVVVSRFNEIIGSRLLAGFEDAIVRHGGDLNAIDVYWVPGAWELPLVALQAAQSGRYGAVAALGCVIRGSTPHFDVVVSEAAKGLQNAALTTGVPVTLGLLTTENLEQALERAGSKAGNKGWDAAMAAIEMSNLLASLRPKKAALREASGGKRS